MKKIYSFIFGCAALTLAASCAQELSFTHVEKPGEEANLVNITVIASEKPEVVATTETKTFIDGTSVKWSDSGEKLKVFEVATPAEGDVVTTQATTLEGETSDSGVTMSFEVPIADKSGGSYDSFDYYAIYPSSAYQTGSAVTGIALNTKGAQTPTATNFDASQDLLIAKKIENGAAQASTLVMQFARVVAIGKMTIKNLESTDPITKITFSAKVGEEAVALAGRTNFNLETAKPVSAYASNTQDYAVILNYEGQNITANTSAGMVAYFTCYPFAINAVTPGSFKVVVETATQSFTKEVNVSSVKGLAFNIGKASVFSVDMDGIAGVDKAVDLRYAYLDYEDYVNAGGTGSYTNVTVDKTYGDSWVTFALTSNGAIGLGNTSGSNANAKASYIKLPDFDKNIKTVIVHFQSITADKTITLETSASGTTGSIASLTTTDALIYTFDLTSESVKTAYLRSNGFQSIITKIEVYAGDDNRTQLSAPASISAAVNSESANSIDVSWGEVSGAGSYIVTLESDGNDDVVVETELLSITVANLENSTDYMVGVLAIPADAYINTQSEVAYYSDFVTTGTGTIDYSTIETSNVSLGAGTNGSSATVNGETAIKVGTSKAGGTMTVTIPANTTKLHVHAAAWNGVTGLSLSITGATTSPSSISLDNDTGIANNTPFTLAGNPEDYYFEITVSGVETETTLTFTSASAKRFVVWGVNAEQVVDDRTTVSLEFAEDAYEFVVNSTEYNAFVPQTATASPNVAAITNAITYAVSDPNGVVSGFNTSTGSFSLTGETGTATITASYGGDAENYKPAEDVSYTVKVTSGTTKSAVTITMSEAGFANAADMTEFTVDGVVVTPGSGVKYYTSGASARIYANNTFKISCTEAPITSMEFTYSQGAFVQASFDKGTYSSGTWTGSANEINMTNGTGAQVRISTIVVHFD